MAKRKKRTYKHVVSLKFRPGNKQQALLSRWIVQRHFPTVLVTFTNLDADIIVRFTTPTKAKAVAVKKLIHHWCGGKGVYQREEV